MHNESCLALCGPYRNVAEGVRLAAVKGKPGEASSVPDA